MTLDIKRERGERIRTLRKSAKLTLNQLAADLGIKYQAVLQWERGETSPSVDNIARLSLRFTVHPTWLWTGQGPEHIVENKVTSIKASETNSVYGVKSYSPDIQEYIDKLADILHGDDEHARNAIKANIDALYRYHCKNSAQKEGI
ncbi:MAG: helix-turn-helix transcriptional regulator [bacterium]|nr:helix-turn-helix transcriptional regulator [bacterium]